MDINRSNYYSAYLIYTIHRWSGLLVNLSFINIPLQILKSFGRGIDIYN